MIDNKSFFASVEAVERNLDPLKVRLIVMNTHKNTGSGLVVSASPMAKKVYHLVNVEHGMQVPHYKSLLQVPPRHWLYEEYSHKINQLYRQKINPKDVYPYSIDESLLRINQPFAQASQIAKSFQNAVYQHFGLYTTVGIGQNPVQAKLALDLLSKKATNMQGTITDDNATDILWPITNLTDIWSIGRQTAKKLKKLDINSIGDLAHFDQQHLHQVFKSRAKQLHALAWGQDIGNHWFEETASQQKSVSASKIFSMDVANQKGLEKRFNAIIQSLVKRLDHRQGKVIGIYFRYSNGEFISHTKTLPNYIGTFNEIQMIALEMLNQYRQSGQPVRQLGISLSNFKENQHYENLKLFWYHQFWYFLT